MIRESGIFRATAIASMVFALVGFSYNVWRMEVTEQNATQRDAAFQMLDKLAQIQLIVYSAYYDKDAEAGNPRQGWVAIGVLEDLSLLLPTEVQQQVLTLQQSWQSHWPQMAESEAAAGAILASLDDTRMQVRASLVALD